MILSIAEINKNLMVTKINTQKDIKKRLKDYSITENSIISLIHKNKAVLMVLAGGGVYAISKNITDKIVVEYA